MKRLLTICLLTAAPLLAADRPSILWITSEDNSPYLGCYGDPLALTPNLDRLAAEGIRYRHAFANAPVCSTARSTLITGMYASTLGIHHHRSRVPIPESFRLYPEYLRAAGYYCVNNSKTDYNISNAGQPWDESSNRAHYRNRKPGQPFFAIFNLTTSHEGQLTEKIVQQRRQRGQLPPQSRVAPAQVKLPPYHPDTPVMRRDWAVYYDNMTLMDRQAGEHLKELERDGLAEDTIVFYYSDHGGALPRGKRNIHDSGTRVPLIIRFPKKWAHLAPAEAGQWVDQPVSFVDLPPTLLSLIGAPIPAHLEGRAFLGPNAAPPRDHVFLLRGRMDERYDEVRAIRDRRFRYIRNYNPHRPWGQGYTYPFEVMPSMRSWFEAYQNGQCNPVQARYWQAKPPEELYDLDEDPFEIHNLAWDPAQAHRLAAMRKLLDQEILASRDTGLIPESMFDRLAGNQTVYEYAHSDAYPLVRILELANQAILRDPALLPTLQTALNDPHPVIRYWGAMGCLILQHQAAPAKAALLHLLEDPWPVLQITAAEALSHLSETDRVLTVLESIAKTGREYDALDALNTLDFMQWSGIVTREQVRSLLQGPTYKGLPGRMANYFDLPSSTPN